MSEIKKLRRELAASNTARDNYQKLWLRECAQRWEGEALAPGKMVIDTGRFANGKTYRVASRCKNGSIEQRDVKVDEIWLALDMAVTLLRGQEHNLRDSWQQEELRKILDVAWGPNR